MEIFADFGLFEVAAVLGLGALARAVYSRRLWGSFVLLLSVAAPLALMVLAREEPLRWLAAVALGTALVNATVVLGAMRTGSVPWLVSNALGRRAHPPLAPPLPVDPALTHTPTKSVE
jgi:hypothetical protein